MPERIQLSRAKGWRMPVNTVKVDRATRWGNPYNATSLFQPFMMRGLPAPCIPWRTPPSLDRCLDLFLAHLRAMMMVNPDFLEPLRGKNLGCWCKVGEPCHGDILLRLANEMPA